MQSKASSVETYIAQLPEERQKAIILLRMAILKNIPKGFNEVISYGMIGYVVPHSIYAAGYHCDPKLPLPFMSIASQKNFIALYHMGVYADPVLLQWFTEEYAKADAGKLDMGKSCIRFTKPGKMPIALIGGLAAKMTPQQWIEMYEKNYKRVKS